MQHRLRQIRCPNTPSCVILLHVDFAKSSCQIVEPTPLIPWPCRLHILNPSPLALSPLNLSQPSIAAVKPVEMDWCLAEHGRSSRTSDRNVTVFLLHVFEALTLLPCLVDEFSDFRAMKAGIWRRGPRGWSAGLCELGLDWRYCHERWRVLTGHLQCPYLDQAYRCRRCGPVS